VFLHRIDEELLHGNPLHSNTSLKSGADKPHLKVILLNLAAEELSAALEVWVL
jgi:hypothetical protein